VPLPLLLLPSLPLLVLLLRVALPLLVLQRGPVVLQQLVMSLQELPASSP
jgi:hypothetical protein